MKIKSFKELLLRKAEGNTSLQTLIKYANEDILVDNIVESLKKMAIANKNRGARKTGAINEWSKNMHIETPEIVRHAIGHHVSQGAAASKAGNHDLAKKHISQAMKMVYIVDQAEGKEAKNINIYAPQTRAWDRTAFSKKYKDDPKSLHRLTVTKPELQQKYTPDSYLRGLQGLKYWRDDTKHTDFLLNAPSDSPSVKKQYGKQMDQYGKVFTKTYPFRELKINGKHIPIDHDVVSDNKYTPHAFDDHPIMKEYKSDNIDSFKKQFNEYQNSDSLHNFIDSMQQMQQNEPEKFAAFEEGKKSDKIGMRTILCLLDKKRCFHSVRCCGTYYPLRLSSAGRPLTLPIE